MTMQDLAREALQVQDACNLSGVARSFAEAMVNLRRLEPDKGTSYYNYHPIAVLWSSKIASLTCSDSYIQFSKAYDWAKEITKDAVV